jgi:Asp-tRNA(Asn)/Glu-tRNA(Gln) amidotransferase A subunit family amidase
MFSCQSIDHLESFFNQREPQILAFLPEAGRFERLRREARSLAHCFPNPETRPPLYGTLVGVKDILQVEGFPTRAGSRLPPEVFHGAEAECVTRLKQAGALILGRTTISEFAYTAPTPTRNPRHMEHTPGGSSSGSAAAVAAGFCPLALGTQTTGSLIRPAAFCGVVGFKPSYDVGFFTPDVDGASVAAGLLCADWRFLESPLRRPVLGIPEGPYLARASDEGRTHFEAVCQRLASAGYEVSSVPAMPNFQAIAARHNLILDAEAALVHAEWFASYGERYHPETAAMIRRGKRVAPAALNRARAGRTDLRAELMALMDDFSVDLWLSPAAPGPAPKGLNATGDAIMNLPWTHSGLPTLNLPTGKNPAGLPLGLQVTASWYADEKLLAWSAALEQAIKGKNHI